LKPIPIEFKICCPFMSFYAVFFGSPDFVCHFLSVPFALFASPCLVLLCSSPIWHGLFLPPALCTTMLCFSAEHSLFKKVLYK